MEVNFKFEIGDVVTHKTMTLVDSTEGRTDVGFMRPQRMLVVERMMTECPGGLQRYYSVRIADQKPYGGWAIVDRFWKMLEEELIPFPTAKE